MTCAELCRLFCCPPCPSSIAAKLAYIPPDPPTYSITQDADGKESLHLTERAQFLFSHRELALIEAMTVPTRRRNTIACMHVKITTEPRFTLLYSHGNAVDLGEMSSFYVGLGTKLHCNVFAYDYSGYGCSTGSPTESNMYADAEAAWQTMVGRLDIDPMKIIIYGQSIGSVASVDLATRHQCAGIILHSPLLSGIRVMFPNVQRTLFFDPFPSISKITRVQSVVLVLHGTEDEVIQFSHGLCLYERAPNTVDPLWIDGAGHNDIEQYSSYLIRLKKFVQDELPARAAAAAKAAAAARDVAAALAAASDANGTIGNRSAVGDDGVMALAGGMDDDDDAEAGSSFDGDSAQRETAEAACAASDKGRAKASGSTTTDLGVEQPPKEPTAANDSESLQASSTDALLKPDSEGGAEQTLTTTTTVTETAVASAATVLSASEQSLPLSVDCADRAPSATPEQLPLQEIPLDVTVRTGGGEKSLSEVAAGERVSLVYV